MKYFNTQWPLREYDATIWISNEIINLWRCWQSQQTLNVLTLLWSIKSVCHNQLLLEKTSKIQLENRQAMMAIAINPDSYFLNWMGFFNGELSVRSECYFYYNITTINTSRNKKVVSLDPGGDWNRDKIDCYSHAPGDKVNLLIERIQGGWWAGPMLDWHLSRVSSARWWQESENLFLKFCDKAHYWECFAAY